MKNKKKIAIAIAILAILIIGIGIFLAINKNNNVVSDWGTEAELPDTVYYVPECSELTEDHLQEIIGYMNSYDEMVISYFSFDDIYDEDESLEVENEIDYEQLAKQKILFVGGLPETVNKVLSYFSFKKHIGKEYAGNIDVSVVSDVVIFYDFINHGLYYKVINVARDHKLNVIYCRGRNADRIISHIANNLSEQK